MNTPMNANEMVNLLRVRAETQNKRGYSGEASEWLELASLIERLEAEVKRWVDKHNQAALNFQQENAECRRLQEQLADEQDAHESTKLLRDSMYAEKDAQLAASQRRERAAVEDLKLIVDAVREAHCDETCCFACKFDCDTSINDSGVPNCECPGFERDDCFEWRGPQEAREGE